MAEEIQIEEMLEYIWMLEEDHGKAESTRMDDKFGNEIAKDYLNKMVERKLINLSDSRIVFTDNGKNRAKLIIRRHRIAERLLNDVLEMTGDEFEAGALEVGDHQFVAQPSRKPPDQPLLVAAADFHRPVLVMGINHMGIQRPLDELVTGASRLLAGHTGSPPAAEAAGNQ